LDEEQNLRAQLTEALPYLELVSINGADSGDTPQMGWERLIQPLDRGTFDTLSLLRLLRELGYRGPIGLQCYNVPGDQKENLQRSMAAWKELVQKLNSP
jgi:sugar phosphate isomerase/epimerase